MSNYTTQHYDSFDYIHTLTEAEKASGQVVIRIDPYFVSNQWKLGSKDESGALFHNLKTIARFGYKNTPEREVRALIVQSAALARINNIDISDIVEKLSGKVPEVVPTVVVSKHYHNSVLDRIIKNLVQIDCVINENTKSKLIRDLLSDLHEFKNHK